MPVDSHPQTEAEAIHRIVKNGLGLLSVVIFEIGRIWVVRFGNTDETLHAIFEYLPGIRPHVVMLCRLGLTHVSFCLTLTNNLFHSNMTPSRK
jgi:hypothetical protein